jgi:hypothetical protein
VGAAASRDKTVLHYEGDVGVALQHVGPLVGRRAHALLWPRITQWITQRSRGPSMPNVFCEVCLKEVPKDRALVSETHEHTAYFCSAECYDKWTARAPHEAEPPAAEAQLGHGRSRSRDDRLKRAERQHPERDEPKIEE